MAYEPLGYSEITLEKQKELELVAAIILKPFIEKLNKDARATDTVIKFLAVWINFFQDKLIKTRIIDAKEFSKNVNAEIKSLLLELGLIESSSKGFYKLKSSVWETAQDILQHLAKHPYAPIDDVNIKNNNVNVSKEGVR